MDYSRPPPAPAMKPEAGDAQWAHHTYYEPLGFVFNGKDHTVQHLTSTQPAAKSSGGMADDTAKPLKKNRAALRKLQSIVGKCAMLPLSRPRRGLFTLLNRTLQGTTPMYLPCHYCRRASPLPVQFCNVILTRCVDSAT